MSGIGKSAEDYLECILIIEEQLGSVRSCDIVQRLGVSKPSVCYAMKRLSEKGYIIMSDQKYIALTESGLEIAQRIYERHKVLEQFFLRIGVAQSIAKTDACKVEHDISDSTYEKIKAFLVGSIVRNT